MIAIVGFDFERKIEREIPPAELQQALQQGLFCWVDILCPSCSNASPDCPDCIGILRQLGINEMAVHEVLGTDREGRYDAHEDCLHFAVSEARFSGTELQTSHVDLVLGAQFLLTYRRRDAECVKHMRRTYRADFHKFARSPGFLLYEVGDHLLEMYRRSLRSISEAVEQAQLRLFGEVDDAIFRHVAALTQNLLVFRKIVLASRELMHELATRKSPFVSESTQPFLESLAGTLERIGNDLTTEREVLNETLNLYMGMVSHKTNKVVNRLTAISAIFLPLSFLCGVYGMNLADIPETKWTYGYPLFWGVALTITAGLLFVMRKRKWL